jgi:lipopolysaccharide export system permease protein
VLVFIVYYIFDNSGMRMAREDQWAVWFGKWLPTMVLAPMAIFFTYKANNDSVVFNIDAYKSVVKRILGLRQHRNITRKEVIIEDPKYMMDAKLLLEINNKIQLYNNEHKLLFWPNPVKVFFREGDDHEMEYISNVLEMAIEDLAFTKDKFILTELNHYPILATHAHTRPFRRRWLNIITGLLLPVGVFFYFRMIRFRLRLYKDLRAIRQTSERIIPRVQQLGREQGDLLTDPDNYI